MPGTRRVSLEARAIDPQKLARNIAAPPMTGRRSRVHPMLTGVIDRVVAQRLNASQRTGNVSTKVAPIANATTAA